MHWVCLGVNLSLRLHHFNRGLRGLNRFHSLCIQGHLRARRLIAAYCDAHGGEAFECAALRFRGGWFCGSTIDGCDAGTTRAARSLVLEHYENGFERRYAAAPKTDVYPGDGISIACLELGLCSWSAGARGKGLMYKYIW